MINAHRPFFCNRRSLYIYTLSSILKEKNNIIGFPKLQQRSLLLFFCAWTTFHTGNFFSFQHKRVRGKKLSETRLGLLVKWQESSLFLGKYWHKLGRPLSSHGQMEYAQPGIFYWSYLFTQNYNGHMLNGLSVDVLT